MHKGRVFFIALTICVTVTWALVTGGSALLNWPGTLAPHQFAAFLILIAFFGPGLTMLNRWAKRENERKGLHEVAQP